jgi:uncharacterized membrane protein
MKKLNSIIYGVFGAGALLYGVANLLFPATLVKEARTFPFSHIMREEAAAAIFIGCMMLWCIFNYERRRVVHYFLIVFALLIAGIHWFDYVQGHLNWKSPLLNTIPLIAFMMMAVGSRSEAPA